MGLRSPGCLSGLLGVHTKLTCYLKVHDILNTAFLQMYEIYKVANEQAFYFDIMQLWENSIENN